MAEVTSMKSSDAERELRKLFSKPVEQLTPREAFAVMLDFYQNRRADDVNIKHDGDMLLFESGIYSFSGPETFQIGLTRQFSVEGDEDDDEPYQLHLTMHYAPTPELKSIKSVTEWCGSPAELDAFRKFIESSAAFKAVADAAPDRVELHYEQC
jgi:hypothetical protein